MKEFVLTIRVDENGYEMEFDGVSDFTAAELVGYLEYAKLDALKQGMIEDERWEGKKK